MSENGWGGPTRDQRKKTLVFPHESPKMHALGLSDTGHNPVSPRWGFSHLGRQTECERIPKPRKDFATNIQPASPLRRLSSLLVITLLPRPKFLPSAMLIDIFLDSEKIFRVAKPAREFILREHSQKTLSENNDEAVSCAESL
jgi:hypothetical protein